MNVIDARQTGRIVERFPCLTGERETCLYEVNPLSRALVGARPSKRDAYQLMATYAVSHYLISKYMPKKLRPYWHGSMIIGKFETVRKNQKLGLGY